MNLSMILATIAEPGPNPGPEFQGWFFSKFQENDSADMQDVNVKWSCLH